MASLKSYPNLSSFQGQKLDLLWRDYEVKIYYFLEYFLPR